MVIEPILSGFFAISKSLSKHYRWKKFIINTEVLILKILIKQSYLGCHGHLNTYKIVHVQYDLSDY